jgi:hypothetical protein
VVLAASPGSEFGGHWRLEWRSLKQVFQYQAQGGESWNCINDPKRADTTNTNVVVMGAGAQHGFQKSPNIGNSAQVYMVDPTWRTDFSGAAR